MKQPQFWERDRAGAVLWQEPLPGIQTVRDNAMSASDYRKGQVDAMAELITRLADRPDVRNWPDVFALIVKLREEYVRAEEVEASTGE